MERHLIIIRGGGELGTAVAHRMHRAGYDVLILERERPTALRREASFSDAVYDGEKTIERVTCRCAESLKNALSLLSEGSVTMMVDPTGRYVRKFPPHIIVNTLPGLGDEAFRQLPANYRIGLGAGYCASQDVNCVIETRRGHSLGRIIYSGRSRKWEPAGSATEIIHAEVTGTFKSPLTIPVLLKEGDHIAEIVDERSQTIKLTAKVDGVLRGIIHDDITVTPGVAVAEIDPHADLEDCCTISYRGRAVSGSVLEAVMSFEHSTR